MQSGTEDKEDLACKEVDLGSAKGEDRDRCHLIIMMIMMMIRMIIMMMIMMMIMQCSDMVPHKVGLGRFQCRRL